MVDSETNRTDRQTECDVLRDLVPFVQFKNVKNTHDGVLLKETLIPGCFSRFLNYANGTKSRMHHK